jgi:ABC-type uncharacterized transport system permease subunit
MQYFTLTRPKTTDHPYALIMGALAILFHTLSFHGTFLTGAGLHVGIYNISSLIGWLIVIIVISSSLRKPLENLYIGVYPLAALSVVLAIVNQDLTQPLFQPGLKMASHIILSVVAYSVLTIAALQSLLLAIQDHHLHHKITNSLIMNLPPLQVMEKLLFEVIWVGFILLASAIITGFIFIEDIFAQHLVHKTALSILAWTIFSILLLGRHRLGWRGTTAIRYTLAGYTLLMLAFIGTKLVLEVILQRAG